MRKIKRQYKKPKMPWNKERMDKEDLLIKNYGLRKKQEIWKLESILRSYRRRARNLAAKKDKVEEKILLDKLYKMGLLNKTATLDNVLSLKIEDIISRRLQTIILKKTIANTVKQARQLITHGHIAVDGRRITHPGFMVIRDMENKIEFYGKPLNKPEIKDVKTEVGVADGKGK
jgi:small subunit ribosomal protein S4